MNKLNFIVCGCDVNFKSLEWGMQSGVPGVLSYILEEYGTLCIDEMKNPPLCTPYVKKVLLNKDFIQKIEEFDGRNYHDGNFKINSKITTKDKDIYYANETIDELTNFWRK